MKSKNISARGRGFHLLKVLQDSSNGSNGSGGQVGKAAGFGARYSVSFYSQTLYMDKILLRSRSKALLIVLS
jgi:hypothetical protein